MKIPRSFIRRYWFGVDDPEAVADTVLLMERDRLEQYKAGLDLTLNHFQGVFRGITGLWGRHRLSVVYSLGPAHIADCVSFLSYGFGVRRFLATGSVGGLNAGMGDIILAQAVTTQDGFSLAACAEQVQVDPVLGYVVHLAMPGSLAVSAATRNAIKDRFECDIHTGSVFTVPAVCLEDEAGLQEIKKRGYLALDLETGPFLAACHRAGAWGACIHWVTDLPLERSFYYQYDGDPAIIRQDWDKKHRQWLNMPRLILPLVAAVLEGIAAG